MGQITRSRRAQIRREATAIRMRGQRAGLPLERIVTAICTTCPEVLPLEAWRLALGWSRAQTVTKVGDLYLADGLQPTALSEAMLCRYEHGQDRPGPEYAVMLARAYEARPDQLGLPIHAQRCCVASPTPLTAVVTVSEDESDDEREDPMRRRTLIKAVGLSVPLHLLSNLEDTLAVPAEIGHPATLAEVQQRLRTARNQFDASALTPLLGGFPGMLAVALDTAERVDTPAGWALLASCYNLATDTLNKVGRKETARLTADRGVTYAQRSGEPVAMAASARALGMMLRTAGRHAAATKVVERAADTLEVMGLRTAPQMGMYLRLMCTSAYTQSQAGNRVEAFARLAQAERAADRLTALTGKPHAGPFAKMYRVNINYSLGDVGAALRVGQDLRSDMYPTPERQGRLHTDLARAWWLQGQPEETASALRAAVAVAPSEVRDRPRIREIADALTVKHPRVTGVRELATALA
ncbi:helix-turn-helix transcriptional regulator [Streptosporangium sp. NPDC051022]|uniref:helix-turn-helix domain-containing protein n=1 Tax=Streptosporangium sp. NPDC051022 TaxID=3155752 RepID=UPI0034120F74